VISGGEGSEQEGGTGEVDGPDQRRSRVLRGGEDPSGGLKSPGLKRDSAGGDPPSRHSLIQSQSAITAHTSGTDHTGMSTRTARTDCTTLPDKICLWPVGSAVGSSSSIPRDDDEDDLPSPPHGVTPSSRRESSMKGSTDNSLDRRNTGRRSGESGHSGHSADAVSTRASSSSIPQSSQARSHSHLRQKSEAEQALSCSETGGRGGSAGVRTNWAGSKEGTRRSRTKKCKEAAAEGEQVVGNKLRGE